MKIDKFLILIILAIFSLSFAVYWQVRNFQKSLSEIEFPKFEMPKMETFLPEGQEGYKEFVSPDEKLKLKYSASWIEMTKESLAQLSQEALENEAKTLFFANKFILNKAAFASLIIQELSLGKEESLEEIIDKIKKEEGKEILKSEIKEKEAYLEVGYKGKTGSVFYSKEKIFLSGNKAYLISVLALEKDWPGFEKETEEIFNSIQIIP
jgi:hypothetical protein